MNVKWLWIRVTLVAFLLAAAGAASSVQAAQDSLAGLLVDQVDLSRFPLVQLDLSVWDARGLLLSVLRATDFRLLEEGVEIAPASLEVLNDAPLEVVLVIDVSGSMAGQPL